MGVSQLFKHFKEYFIVKGKTPQQSQLWATQWPFLYDFTQKINSEASIHYMKAGPVEETLM